MRLLFTLLAGLFVLSAAFAGSIQGQEVDQAEQQEGFVSMFNGQDFSGWQFGGGYGLPDPLPENWSVADGVIRLSGGGRPNLGSQWDYEDFDMRFQWRALREKHNSGFYIRSNRKVGNNQINLAKGGEGRFFGGKMDGGKPVPELQKPAMEWNDWRVVCSGGDVTFYCNGTEAWQGTNFASTRGHIGLQAEGAPLEFRNLRIKELGYTLLQGEAGSGPATTKEKNLLNYTLRLEFLSDKTDVPLKISLRGKDGKNAVCEVSTNQATLGGAEADKVKEPLLNPAGQWNYLQVSVADGKVNLWCNGQDLFKAAALAGDAPPQGGVEVAGAAGLQLRNVRIRQD